MIKFSVTQWHHFSGKMMVNTGKGVATGRCSPKHMHLPEITENRTSIWIRGLNMFLISKSWSTSSNQSCSVLSSPKSHTHTHAHTHAHAHTHTRTRARARVHAHTPHTSKQHSTFGKVMWLQAGWMRNYIQFLPGPDTFFFCRMTRPHLGPTQHPI